MKWPRFLEDFNGSHYWCHFQRSSNSCFEKCKASFWHEIPHSSSSFYFLINTWLDHCECHIKDTSLNSCQKFFFGWWCFRSNLPGKGPPHIWVQFNFCCMFISLCDFSQKNYKIFLNILIVKPQWLEL
jgi:hypothetical protein